MQTRLILLALVALQLSACLINTRLYNELRDELPAECGDEDYTPPNVGPDPCENPTPTVS